MLFFDGADLSSTQTEDDVESLKVKKAQLFRLPSEMLMLIKIKVNHLNSQVPLLTLILEVMKVV